MSFQSFSNETIIEIWVWFLIRKFEAYKLLLRSLKGKASIVNPVNKL